ncbi:MAG: peptidoglycan-binding protein [Parcubacteria group bacterium]|nr:peptidoglycan-binding protein [Parcubacteria group bacterium]
MYMIKKPILVAVFAVAFLVGSYHAGKVSAQTSVGGQPLLAATLESLEGQIKSLQSQINKILDIIVGGGGGTPSSRPAPSSCGDFNSDKLISQNDIDFLRNYVFLGSPAPADKTRADINGDGVPTASDVVVLQNFLAGIANAGDLKCPAPVVASKPAATSCGDFNGDKLVTQSDIDFLQNFAFLGSPVPADPRQSDINGDGVFPTSADLVTLQNYLYVSGPAPKCTPPIAASRPALSACGDFNSDKLISQSDIDFILNFTFLGGPRPVDPKQGDVNGDGIQTASDVVYLQNHLYLNGPDLKCPAGTVGEFSRPTTESCGDFNGDGFVKQYDVDFLRTYAFLGDPAPRDKTRADVNGDKLVNAGDVIYLDNYLKVNGPALKCPAPPPPPPPRPVDIDEGLGRAVPAPLPIVDSGTGSGTGSRAALTSCGDFNRDKVINQSDIDFLSNYVFQGRPAPSDKTRADVNGDGLATASDVVYLQNYAFLNGPALKCPAPVVLSRPAVSGCGDFNSDKIITQSDVDFLQNYAFQGAPAPADPRQADVNGDGVSANSADLIYLQNYLHRVGESQLKCPAPFTPSRPAVSSCGDFNGDRLITREDVEFLQNYAFLGTPVPSSPRQADVNGDGIYPTASDLVYLQNYLYINGPELQCSTVQPPPKPLFDLESTTLQVPGFTQASVSCRIPELSLGAQSNSVALLQDVLNKEGHYPRGLITGYFGSLTEDAVGSLQRKVGLPVTRQVNVETAAVVDGITPKYYAVCESSRETQASCGDFNGDKLITQSDLNFLINFAFLGSPKPADPKQADVNGDGISANGADVVYLSNHIYKNGPAPKCTTPVSQPTSRPTTASCGDFNGDNLVTQSDIDFLRNFAFLGTPAPKDKTRADVNGDGISANSADVVYLENYLKINGPALKCPAPVVISRPATTSCGDFNADKLITASDTEFLRNFTFLGTPVPADPKQADINGDGVFPTSADLVWLENYLAAVGPAPKCTPPIAANRPALSACGDFNSDKLISQSDVDFILNYTFLGGPRPVDARQGDVNGDGTQTASDVIYLQNYLYINGPDLKCPAGTFGEFSRPTVDFCGDYNRDGLVKQADVDALQNFAFLGTPVWPEKTRANVDGSLDGAVTATDVIYLQNFLKANGPALQCPAPPPPPPPRPVDASVRNLLQFQLDSITQQLLNLFNQINQTGQ